jgi:YtcA family
MNKLHLNKICLSVILIGLIFLTGCRGAPSINLLGSFFPGWMLCMALGAVGTFIFRQIFVRTEIEPHLGPRWLVYFCLWLLITLTTWLFFFRS